MLKGSTRRWLLATTIFIASPALAQQVQPDESGATVVSEGGLEDIVVTARRRAEPLQQTPLAVSAVNADRLAEARVSQLAQVTTLAPSLYLSRDAVVSSRILAFIRGFGSKSSDPAVDPAVPITIDGIYQGMQIGTFINLFDVETVEVLRGPQGTLLGKNSPAGGLSIRTRRPSGRFAGMAQVDYGSYGDLQVRAYLDVPVAQDKLAATISYFRQRSDGYIRNTVFNDRRGGIYSQSLRLGLLATPNDDVTWYVSGQYDLDKGEDPSVRNISTTTRLVIPTANYSAAPAPISLTCVAPVSAGLCASGALPNQRRYTTMGSILPRRDNKNLSLVSDLAVDAGPISIASVTGYRRFLERSNQDIDGTQIGILDVFQRGNYKQLSQEGRISSNDGGGLDLDGKLNWLVGAYYFYFDYDRTINQIALGTAGKNNQQQTTNSYALFAHAEYKLTEQLIASAGMRKTWDHKRHNSRSVNFFRGLDTRVVESASWSNFSIDATLEYHLTSDKMIFARYAEGYRGGGFTGVPATAALAAKVDPETVTSYEGGIKMDFFNRRARLNIATYIAKYKDLQRSISVSTPFPPFYVQLPKNIAAATTKGFEVEAQLRPVQPLTIRGSIGYVDAKYTSYVANLTTVQANGETDNSALKFPFISKWTASLGITYDVSLNDLGKLVLAGDYAYRSRYNMTDQSYDFAEQKGYGLLSASITWTDASDRFSLSVYGKNLTDKYHLEEADAVGGLTTWVAEGSPRTYGISAGFKF